MSATDAERLVQIAVLAAAEHCCTVTPDATMADLAAYVHNHTMGYLLTAWLASPSAAVREAAEALDEAVGSQATREALHAALCRTLPLPRRQATTNAGPIQSALPSRQLNV